MRAVANLNKTLPGVRFASTSLSSARRLQNRSGWASVKLDEDHVVFPDEHLGNHYDLNWAIAGYNMSAAGKAFHNLHQRGLVMQTSSPVDGNKAVLVKKTGAGKEEVLVVGEGVSDADFGGIVRHARETLTDSDAMYVQDGALGLSKDSGPTIRSFCSDAESALLLHNLTRSFQLPLSTEDPHTLTQFLVPAGPNGESFSVIDPVRRIAVHAGANVNVDAVRSSLVQLATLSETWAQGTTVLGADAYLTEQGPVVVFGGAPSIDAWSAKQTLWTAEDTLVPVWYAAAVSGAPTQFGDYVEVAGDSQVVVGGRRTPTEPFSAPAPKALLFVEKSKKKAVKINPQQAKKLGLPESLADRVTKHKIGLFSVPPQGKTPTHEWIKKTVV